MSEDRIRKQMDKLGNTEFEWDELDIQMGEQIFLPVKTLNELRREAIALLEQELCAPYRRSALILLLWPRRTNRQIQIPAFQSLYPAKL